MHNGTQINKVANMSKYIAKRVSYECGFCKKQFTLNKQSIDDSEKSGEVFCSKQCAEQFYLSDVSGSLPDANPHICPECSCCNER